MNATTQAKDLEGKLRTFNHHVAAGGFSNQLAMSPNSDHLNAIAKSYREFAEEFNKEILALADSIDREIAYARSQSL